MQHMRQSFSRISRSVVFLVGGPFIATSLSACSLLHPLPHVEPDYSATAVLNLQTGEIDMPVDDYDVYGHWTDTALFEHAQRIAELPCMQSHGHSYTAAFVTPDPASSIGERTYGLWDVERARQYGFGSGANPVKAAYEADQAAAADPEQWNDDLNTCSTEARQQLTSIFPAENHSTPSIVGQIRSDAYALAANNPQWQAARDEYAACLTDHGLVPATGPGEWGSKAYEAPGFDWESEEATRVAITEAQRNTDTQLSQRLANLEAAYQAPLVKQHEAELQQLAADKSARLAAAEAYIAQHG